MNPALIQAVRRSARRLDTRAETPNIATRLDLIAALYSSHELHPLTRRGITPLQDRHDYRLPKLGATVCQFNANEITSSRLFKCLVPDLEAALARNSVVLG